MARDTAIIQIVFSYRRDKYYLSEGGTGTGFWHDEIAISVAQY
jgi:hypothetical protein